MRYILTTFIQLSDCL